jgi:hypothetical protein
MRRLFLITCLVLSTLALSAQAAWAGGPTHILKQTFSGSFSVPAGELCDFDYSQSFTVVDTGVIFGDPDNPTRTVINETEFNTHTNLDTGYSLSERDQIVFQFDASDAQFKQVGIFWHLRNADGKIVVVQAGQLLFNTDTGELLKFTPNLNPDFAAVLCTALGGQPAI